MSRNVSLGVFRFYPKLKFYSPCFKSNIFLSNTSVKSNQINALPKLKNIQVSKLLQPYVNSSVDEVLSYIDLETTTGEESVTYLKALRLQTLFGQTSSSSFIKNDRFKDLCKIYERNLNDMPPNLIVSGLRSLLEVGMLPDSSCVVAAEQGILRNIYNFTTMNLIGCLYFHIRFVKTNLQKKVVDILVKQVHDRLLEVKVSSEVFMLAHIYHLCQGSYKKDAEDTIIERLRYMDIHELCKIVCILAETSNRSVPILNEVSFCFKNSITYPDVKETLDLFYALKKLNFYHPDLFFCLLNHMESKVPSIIKPSFISGLLTICGQLRWRHAGILNACGEWIEKNLQACTSREFVAFILAMAALNYCSSQTQTTLKLLLPHFTLESLKSPNILLDVAWSCGILDVVTRDMLLTVISPDFYKTLIDSNSTSAQCNTLKLLNLKAILKKKHPECVFKCNLFLEPKQLKESVDIQNCRQHIISVLCNFVPKVKHLSINQISEYGIPIDAEFIISSNLKPLSLEKHGTLSEPIKDNPLPKNSKRIALLVMFHKDYTLYSEALSGINALGIQILRDIGYTVVVISYNDFSRNRTEIQKAKFLFEKISFAVNNT